MKDLLFHLLKNSMSAEVYLSRKVNFLTGRPTILAYKGLLHFNREDSFIDFVQRNVSGTFGSRGFVA